MREPTLEDVKALYEQEYEGDIATLECKCAAAAVEYTPSMLDLIGNGCNSGDDDPEDAELFTSPLYARCIQQFNLGIADVGTVSPRTCADPDATDDFFENSCLSFVSDLQTQWAAKKQKVSAMHNSVEFAVDIVDDYIDVCFVSLTKQKDFIDMLYSSMQHFGVSDTSRADFDSNTRSPFLDAYFEFGDPICAWDDDNDLLYTRLLDGEQANLDAAYANHFDSCSPSACTYEELETVVDLLLKTIAVLSPLLSSTMAIAALIYKTTEKDNWDDADSGLGNVELKERQSDEDDA